MTAASPNRVRELREARGLSQMALAVAVSLTRQSVGAIEAGRATPAVDVAIRLGQALGCPVEELFGACASEDIIPDATIGASGGRLALGHIAGRWVSYPLSAEGMWISADAIAASPGHGVELLRPGAEARDNLIMMGCIGAMGLIAERLNACPGAGRFLWLGRSSSAALEALAADRTHLAGVHLTDDSTGESNVPDVRRHGIPAAIVLTTLGRWEAGLVVAAGNPKRIRGVADLGRRGLRLVVREPGSGARRLLERDLLRAGLSLQLGDAAVVGSHLAVADAVALGAVDVGVATRDVAILRGLHFVPLAEERLDLATPLALIDDPRIQRLFNAMTAAPFRRELRALGYDVAGCGERVAEVPAA